VACYEKNYRKGGGTADVMNSIMSGSINGSVYADSISEIRVSPKLPKMCQIGR